jgi:hypothetical protein
MHGAAPGWLAMAQYPREETRMKRCLLFVLVSVMTAFGVGVAHGKDCQGVNFPEHVQIDGGTLTLNGLGLRQATILKVNVYVAGLYVANVSSDPQALLGSHTPKELILHFLHNVSDDDLKKAWEEGFVHNAKEQLSALQERIEMLKSLMVDMQSGQRLTFIHKPGAGIQVDVNGTVKGMINGDDFATAFLSIWLGTHPPNPGLKSGLIGGACG